jgi:hypothetical protein
MDLPGKYHPYYNQICKSKLEIKIYKAEIISEDSSVIELIKGIPKNE